MPSPPAELLIDQQAKFVSRTAAGGVGRDVVCGRADLPGEPPVCSGRAGTGRTCSGLRVPLPDRGSHELETALAQGRERRNWLANRCRCRGRSVRRRRRRQGFPGRRWNLIGRLARAVQSFHRVFQVERLLGRLLAVGVARHVFAGFERRREEPPVAEFAQRAERAEAFLVEADSVRFQDRAGLALEAGQLDVVQRQVLGFRTDGVAPVGNRQADVDEGRLAGARPTRKFSICKFRLDQAASRVSWASLYCAQARSRVRRF